MFFIWNLEKYIFYLYVYSLYVLLIPIYSNKNYKWSYTYKYTIYVNVFSAVDQIEILAILPHQNVVTVLKILEEWPINSFISLFCSMKPNKNHVHEDFSRERIHYGLHHKFRAVHAFVKSTSHKQFWINEAEINSFFVHQVNKISQT